MERQPTCHFVQVIIGCVTAKAGHGMGSFAPHDFYGQFCKLFSFSWKSYEIPLETRKGIGYNNGVYAPDKAIALPFGQ